MFLFFSSSLSLVSLSLSLPLSLFISLSLPLRLTISTQQSYPPPATSHHNSNDHHNNQRPTLMRPTLIKSIKLTIHVGQLNDLHRSRWWSMNTDPWTQTHELKPTNLDPQNHRSTIIGRAHSSANHIGEAQREKREERSERGKRKIEEREPLRWIKKNFSFTI